MPTFSLVACAIATFIWVDGKMISGKFPGVVIFVFCLLSACLGNIYIYICRRLLHRSDLWVVSGASPCLLVVLSYCELSERWVREDVGR